MSADTRVQGSDEVLSPGFLPAGPDAAVEHLGGLVRRGLQWSFVGSISLRLGSVLSGIILARILAPRDFGIYAVGAVALAVTASINDLGIEPTIVRWPGNLDAIAPTAFTVVMASSLVLFGVFWAAATPFAHLLNAPHGANIVRLMSAGLLISGLGTVSAGVITRTFRQKTRASAETAAMVVQIGVTIGLAKAGYGAYSLAWGHILGNAVSATLLILGAPVRYRPGFHAATAKLLLRAGLPVAGAGLVTIAIQNVDYVLVGSFLGAGPLGLYLLAWNISSFSVNVLTGAVGHVSVAGFAKLQTDPARLHRAFERSLAGIAGIAVPIAVLLAGLRLPVVRFVYGARWAHTSGPLAFLALVGAIRIMTMLCTDALLAAGKGRLMLTLQAAWLVVLAPALAVGAHLAGIRGVGIAHLVVAVGVAIPIYLIALRRLDFPVLRVTRSVVRPIVGGVCVSAVCFVTLKFGLPDLGELALGGSVGLLVYLVVVRPLWAPLVSSWRNRHAGAILGSTIGQI
jgi:PST family polysaccharide transporter